MSLDLLPPELPPQPTPQEAGGGNDPGRGPRPPGLGTEIARAGRGLLALARGDAAWTGRFDLTTTGFLRSFLGPLLALPLYVFGSALVTRALTNGHPAPDASLWGAGLAHTLDAIGFPLLIALIARPLRIGAGYPAFVIVLNWASLYLNILLAAASLLVFSGHDGLEAFSLATLCLLCVSVFFVWRTARLTLSHEFAPVLLVVVLSVAVSAAAGQTVQAFT